MICLIVEDHSQVWHLKEDRNLHLIIGHPGTGVTTWGIHRCASSPVLVRDSVIVDSKIPIQAFCVHVASVAQAISGVWEPYLLYLCHNDRLGWGIMGSYNPGF